MEYRAYSNRRAARSRQHARGLRGFTLVELMVAVVIGLVILIAVSQIFATSRATYQTEEGLARVQENGRFAMEFISRDLRMAGYAGCRNVNQMLAPSADFSVTNLLNNSANFATNFTGGAHIVGYAYNDATSTWEPPLPAFFAAGEVEPGTDVVAIRRGSADPKQVAPPYMVIPSSAVQLAPGHGLVNFDIVIVSDCTSADVFQITGPASATVNGTLNHNVGVGTPGNAGGNLSKTYGATAQVMRLETLVYYIGRRSPTAPPALMRRALAQGTMGAQQEFVPDVESLKVLYGEDLNADQSADVYRAPAAVTDWSRVASVRLGLLLRTPKETGHEFDTRTYPVAGTDLGPFNDRRQRRVFSATVQLRNLRYE